MIDIKKLKKKGMDADFIAKIKTLNIGTGAKPSHPFPETIKCKDCGKEAKLVSVHFVELHPVKFPKGTNPINN